MSNQPAIRPEQPALDVGHSNGRRPSVRDLADGDAVSGAFAVRERELRQRRDGGEWLRLVISDRTGSMEAVAWDAVGDCFEAAQPGTVVQLSGRFGVHPRYGPKVTIEQIRPAREGEYDPGEIADGPPVAAARLESDLRELIATVQNPSLRRLLERFFGDRSAIWARFREAPAAKHYHQAYRHGLLDHTLSVAQAVLHIVLSHHGALENGSPVVPATREATLVHMLDNLGGRLGSFDRIERALREGETWSRFDPGIESAAYFRSHAA